MKPTGVIFVFVLIALQSGVQAADPVRFTVTDLSGQVKLWEKDASQWVAMSKNTLLDKDRTVMTETGGAVTFTFEPAISISLGENGILSIDNLSQNRQGKTLRMLLTLQRGDADVRILSTSPYALLLTIQTSAGAIDIRDADVRMTAQNDGVRVRILRGDVRVRHNLSEMRVMAYAGSEARIDPLKPQVSIVPDPSQASARPVQRKAPSVAILSMRSSSVKKNDMDRFSEYIAEQFVENSRGRVLFLDEIRTMLRNEDKAKMLECRTDSCIAQIAVLAGVDAVIFGDLGNIGDRYLLSLKMYHVVKDRTVGRVSVSARGDAGNILDSIPGAITELAGQAEALHRGGMRKDSAVAESKAVGGAEMIRINGGTFIMGSRYGKGDIDELPHRNITVSSFCIDKYEVTRDQFERAMGYDPSSYRSCSGCPVDNVTWSEAKKYCESQGKRLATEAEWEYACRAGTQTLFSTGSSISSAQANFDGRYPYGGAQGGNLRGRPLQVGSFAPNPWGIHDMHGNIAEWTQDWYDPVYYGNAADTDPRGPEAGTLKVVRGGSWANAGFDIRCTNRTAYEPSIKLTGIGFRCAADSCGIEK